MSVWLDIAVSILAISHVVKLVVDIRRRDDRESDTTEIDYLRRERDVLVATLHQQTTHRRVDDKPHHCPLAASRGGYTSPCELMHGHDGPCWAIRDDDGRYDIPVIIDAPSDELMAGEIEQLARRMDEAPRSLWDATDDDQRRWLTDMKQTIEKMASREFGDKTRA